MTTEGEQRQQRPYTAVVGGIGGSGTRLGAEIISKLGYYIGDDLNPALDNLWHTLFFKRRSILVESDEDFAALGSLFLRRMSGVTEFNLEERDRIKRLASAGRLQHQEHWLCDRVDSFLSAKALKRVDQPIGWKEPNSYISIERFFSLEDNIRYVHMLRHPLVMAFSNNQNQLMNWGPILLDNEVEAGPRSALSYWCEAHRFITGLSERWPDRVLIVDYDELCDAPDKHFERVAEFLAVATQEAAVSAFRSLVFRRSRRFMNFDVDPHVFETGDLSYIEAIGYEPALAV